MTQKRIIFFFGDKVGHPGMDLTFFIFKPSMQGRRGSGLVTTVSLAVPETAINFWHHRFQEKKVQYEVTQRYGRTQILFYDKDNQQLELVGVESEYLGKENDVWTTAEISSANAIRSFFSATLSVNDLDYIEPVLSHVFGYQQLEKQDRFLFSLPNSKRASFLEVEVVPEANPGLNAAGTVHHIAFRATDEVEQLAMRQRVLQLGLHSTEVIDRFYFKSVYFRIPAGILFEIATDGPGFTADEPEAKLGKKLALPPFLASHRAEIEAKLIPLPYDE